MPNTIKKEPTPRAATYYGMRTTPSYGRLGTWLEPEELAYPSGAMTRRARAINTQTGLPVVVRCGIPDTFFSIPCRGGGWMDSHEGIFRFHPKGAHVQEQEQE